MLLEESRYMIANAARWYSLGPDLSNSNISVGHGDDFICHLQYDEIAVLKITRHPDMTSVQIVRLNITFRTL